MSSVPTHDMEGAFPAPAQPSLGNDVNHSAASTSLSPSLDTQAHVIPALRFLDGIPEFAFDNVVASVWANPTDLRPLTIAETYDGFDVAAMVDDPHESPFSTVPVYLSTPESVISAQPRKLIPVQHFPRRRNGRLRTRSG